MPLCQSGVCQRLSEHKVAIKTTCTKLPDRELPVLQCESPSVSWLASSACLAWNTACIYMFWISTDNHCARRIQLFCRSFSQSDLEVAALCKLRLPQPIAVQAAGSYRVCLVAIADLRCLQLTMYAVLPNKVQRLVMKRHDSSHMCWICWPCNLQEHQYCLQDNTCIQQAVYPSMWQIAIMYVTNKNWDGCMCHYICKRCHNWCHNHVHACIIS